MLLVALLPSVWLCNKNECVINNGCGQNQRRGVGKRGVAAWGGRGVELRGIFRGPIQCSAIDFEVATAGERPMEGLFTCRARLR